MKKFAIFLVLNFGALFLGAQLMGSPVENVWYQQVHKAPWTPPGWVFGAAWFTIMLLFSIYLSRNFQLKNRYWFVLYAIHLFLNIAWNPLFFSFHYVLLSLIVIVLLWVTVVLFMRKTSRGENLFLLPYFIWLLVAISLNGYVLFMNEGI